MSHTPVIEYVNVHKAFDAPVLQGVNLTVDLGETVAIVGPSGTGKSVLLKTTNGLILPDGGDVHVEGESLYFGPRGVLERVRRKVGYVFQYAALMDSISILDNVLLGIPEDELRLIGEKEAIARVSRALTEVRLNPRAVMEKLPG